MVYYRSSTAVIWEAFSRLIFLQYRRNLGSGRLGIYLCLGIRAVITVVVPCCITFQTSPVSQLTHAEPSPHGQSPARLSRSKSTRPSRRVRRGSPPPHRHRLGLLLQRSSDSPGAEQRRPNPSTDLPDRADHSSAHPRWPAPPILSDVVSGQGQPDGLPLACSGEAGFGGWAR
jgi:hypothetical protein